MLNHYVTKSREEFLEKYRKGKLSQATKEEEWDVDRDAFVRLMGDAFVEVSEGLKKGRCDFQLLKMYSSRREKPAIRVASMR